MSNSSEQPKEPTPVLTVLAPEEIVAKARELEQQIADQENEAALLKERLKQVHHRAGELYQELRKTLRTADTPMPLFALGSTDDDDAAPA